MTATTTPITVTPRMAEYFAERASIITDDYDPEEQAEWADELQLYRELATAGRLEANDGHAAMLAEAHDELLGFREATGLRRDLNRALLAMGHLEPYWRGPTRTCPKRGIVTIDGVEHEWAFNSPSISGLLERYRKRLGRD